MKKKKVIIPILILLAVVIAYLFLGTNILPPYRNNEAGCKNCLKQIGLALRYYSNENKEYFPAGKETPQKSLNLLFSSEGGNLASCMAAHSHQPELGKYYEKHRKVPENLSCYRYNEGLAESAPYDGVLLYYYKPIKWENWYTPSKDKGRLVLFVDGHMKFLTEPEFQKKQKATLEWIKENAKGASAYPSASNRSGAPAE